MMSPMQYKVSLLLSGGFSGMVTWFCCFPADTLKTRMQTQPPNCNKTIGDLAMEIYRTRGVFGLYRGIHI